MQLILRLKYIDINFTRFIILFMAKFLKLKILILMKVFYITSYMIPL